MRDGARRADRQRAATAWCRASSRSCELVVREGGARAEGPAPRQGRSRRTTERRAKACLRPRARGGQHGAGKRGLGRQALAAAGARRSRCRSSPCGCGPRPWRGTSPRRRAAAGPRRVRPHCRSRSTPMLGVLRCRLPSTEVGLVERRRGSCRRSAAPCLAGLVAACRRGPRASPRTRRRRGARRCRLRARSGAAARAISAQQLVAGFVTVGVVDRLEVVEVDEEQGAVAAMAAAVGQALAQAVEQEAAIGQIGSSVSTKARLRIASSAVSALGDVDDHAVQPLSAAPSRSIHDMPALADPVRSARRAPRMRYSTS